MEYVKSILNQGRSTSNSRPPYMLGKIKIKLFKIISTVRGIKEVIIDVNKEQGL